MAGDTRAGITLAGLTEEIERRGGEEYVWERVADGDSLRTIARDLGGSRGLLYKWIELDREGRRARLDEARRASAEAHVDKGLAILADAAERPGLTSAEATIASQRAGWHRWLAERRDSEQFGEKRGASVQVTIGQLHLDALRAAGRPTEIAVTTHETRALPDGNVVLDAEVVEE